MQSKHKNTGCNIRKSRAERAILLMSNCEAHIEALPVLNAKVRCHSNLMYDISITRNMPCLPLTKCLLKTW